MSKEDLNVYYAESVKGLDDKLLKDLNSWYNLIMDLPKHLQIVYTVLVYHQQVFNGGHHQYFFNAYGLFGYETIENLIQIKALRTAEILFKALSNVNKEAYSRPEFRNKVFNRKLQRIVSFDESLANYLNDLDNEFDSCEEDVDQLLVDYLEKEILD